MRLLAILALFAASTIAHAQVSVYDCSVSSPNVPAVALEASEPGKFDKPCILLDELNSYNFSNDQELHITADETIHIFEDFHSGQYTGNGNMHLEIKPQEDLDVLLMNYPDLYNVERFGKMELAVVLPQNIQNAVADFVTNGQSATNVNPFDPDQLEIKAYFSPLWQGNWQYPWISHGFYYEEYEHNADTSDWVQLPTPGSKFRIRFAPRVTGLWRCAISVHCPVTGEYWDLNEFQFTVIDTGKPDFMRVGENGKYFKIGSEPFYPFGMNMPTQGRDRAYSAGLNGGTRPKDYNKFFEELQELKDAGGNYFRYMNQPYSTEIEFEKLGDYSDRMSRAWEMDRIVDSLEDLDMRMLYCLAYHLPFTYTGVYSQYFWDWSNQLEAGVFCTLAPNGFGGDVGYCYRSDAVHGVTTVDEFFSDSTLISFYKKRLRYYISRYGYSTRVGKFEFINEINTTASTFGVDSEDCSNRSDLYLDQPYYRDTSFIRKVYEWQNEMARYIKEDLEHDDHLLAANYIGPPNEVPGNDYDFTGKEPEGISLDAGDLSYISPHIDVRSYNDYTKTPNHFSVAAGQIIYCANDYLNYPTKPFFFSEVGNGEAHNCDEMHTFQQLYIMSPFTGTAGAGLPWDYNSSLTSWDDTADRLKGWEPISTMKNFLSGIDLNHDNWTPGTWTSESNKSEVVFLSNQMADGTRAIGVINNLTVNKYTMRENWCDIPDSNGVINCDCHLTTSELNDFPVAWKNRAEIGPLNSDNKLKVYGLEPYKNYTVEYYNTENGNLTHLHSKFSNGSGHVTLEYPTLSSTPQASNGNANGSMIFIKVRPWNESFRTGDTTQTEYGNKEVFDLRDNKPLKGVNRNVTEGDFDPTQSLFDQTSSPRLVVMPNPTTGKTALSVNGVLQETGIWYVTNLYGQRVYENTLGFSRIEVNCANWKPGLYFVNWVSNSNQLTSKLIVK